MSLADTPLAILSEAVNFKVLHSQKNLQPLNSLTTHKHRQRVEKIELPVTSTSKSDLLTGFDNSRSDSGKSSSGSPILLDCSFDSGIAGVLLDSNDMQLHKRIQQCQCILLALDRDREYFLTIRNRLSKITDRKNTKSSESEFICNVCCAEIDPNDEKTYVKCYVCQKYICRNIKCADWLPTTAEWECELCQTSKESLAQTSSWVAEQITFHQEKLICPPRARSEIYIPISECNDSSIHFESVSQIGANSLTITAEQKLKIREYVEEVVAKLLGGNLDTIGVNQLSKSENYLAKDSKANNGTSRESVSIRGNCNDLTDISETRLRQMIQKIIAETMNLPPLSNGHAVSEIALDRRSKINDNRPLTNDGFYQRHRTEHYFEPTIYQDLLATAVLNKIVDKQLNNNQAISESIIGDRDGYSDDMNDNVGLLSSDPNFNIEQSSTTSGSSVEPRSDFSYPEVEQILNTNDDKSSELLRNSDRDSVMSDYLASHMIPLPDLNAMATESDEDDYISVTSSAVGDSTWEKNWLFKKKRSTLSGSVTANSMGMLVPDPKEDVRAQIGDKTADEVSDLSELSSDTDDSLNSLRSKLDPLNDRLINKHLIGGQNSKMVLDELIERSSITSNTLPNNEEPSYTDACNEHVIDAPIRNEAINNNVNQKPNTGDCPRVVVSSVLVEDPSSNTLTASNGNSESDGCTGFSSIEIFEPTSCTPSVVQILAAMALGPMLAIPSADQPITMTIPDFNAFTELKELALAEIQSRSLELTPRNLDVIPEETGDATNQTENIVAKIDSSSEEAGSFKKPDEFGLPQLGVDKCIQQLLQEISPISPIPKIETADLNSSGISSILSEPKQLIPLKLSSTDESAELIAQIEDIKNTQENKKEASSSLTLKVEEESEKSNYNSTKSITNKLRLEENSVADENEDINKFVGIVSSGKVFSDNDFLKTLLSHNECSTLPLTQETEQSSEITLEDDFESNTKQGKLKEIISTEESSEKELLVSSDISKNEDNENVKSKETKPNICSMALDYTTSQKPQTHLEDQLCHKEVTDISNSTSMSLSSCLDTHAKSTSDSTSNEQLGKHNEVFLKEQSPETQQEQNKVVLNKHSSNITPECSSEITVNIKNPHSKSDDPSSEIKVKNISDSTYYDDNKQITDYNNKPDLPENIKMMFEEQSPEKKHQNILDSTSNEANTQGNIHSEKSFEANPKQNENINLEDISDSRDAHLVEPVEIISKTQNGNSKTILKEVLSEIQLQDIAYSSNIKTEKIDKSDQCPKTQPNQNDAVSSDQLSKSKPEDNPFSSDSAGNKNYLSKNKKLDNHLAEPDAIIPEVQNENSETVLKEALSEIQFQDVADSSNTAAEEIDKSDQCRKTQPDQNDIVTNEQLSEVKPEDVADSSDSVADIISESKNNILDDNLAEPKEIIPEAQNGHSDTILREELSEKQFQDVADSGNIAAEERDKSEECIKINPDQNDTVANEQLSETKPEDVADSSDSIADKISESQNNILDDNLAEPEEITPGAQNGYNETILKEELSEIQFQDVADSSNTAAEEIDKSDQCRKTQPDQNDIVTNEQLSEVKPENVADSSDSVADIISESKNNILDDSETILREELSEKQFQDVADSGKIAAEERDKSEECIKINPDQNDTVANEQLSETKPEDVADSSDSIADKISESQNNILDDNLPEAEEITPGAQNGYNEKILKEELSEIQFQDVADSSNTAAEEIDKSEECFKISPDQNDTVANEQLSESKPEDVADSSDSIADIISESQNNILDDNLAEPEEITPGAQNGYNETILKEELSEIQFQDVAAYSNIAAEERDKSEECIKINPDQNDTVANEQLSEAKPEDVADSSDSIADIISESQNNILDDNLAEPEEIIPEAQNRHSEKILKEELSEIQFQDVAAYSNIAAEEIDKSEECFEINPDQNDTVANEQLSETKPEDVADSSDSIADIISESKNNILDDNLAEPEEITPGAQNGYNETILKEQLSEIQFQGVAAYSNIAAEERDKSEECIKINPDQNDTVANEQLSEAKPEDVADSSDSIADIISESQNNILDDNLAEPEEIIPEAQNRHSEKILKEELSKIQFQDFVDSSNTAAEEKDKSDQCRKTQPDQNDTVANEQLSEVKPEDVADSSDSVADITSESQNNILDDNMAEPEEIIPRAQNGHNETILKEELSEIQLQDVADYSNIAATEIDKSEECFKINPDQNETVANEQLSEAKPEDVADSSVSIADIISESQNNILDDNLAEPEEIISEAQNGHSEKILKEELSKIQFQDFADSSNTAAKEINKSDQCRKTQPDQNDTVANEQLSEVKPEDVADSSDSVADLISESKNYRLDDHLAEPEEIIPEAQNGHSETILKEELSEIQFQDVADSSKIAAEEIDKLEECFKIKPDQNETVANEQLSEAKPEDVADSSDSIADIISESQNNILDDNLAEPEEIIPEAKNGHSEKILKEELSKIQFQDVADSSNTAAEEIDKSDQCRKIQPDQNDIVANEQLSEVKPEYVADSSDSVADINSESKNNTLDGHLAEPEEIIPRAQNGHNETILKEELSEIHLQDVADSSNIAANEIDKSEECFKIKPDQNDTVASEELSEAKPEDVADSSDSIADIISESQNNILDDNLAEPEEIIPRAQNGHNETILKEELSEIQFQDVADTSKIAAEEIDKSEECFKIKPDQNDTVASEQLSEAKPEDVADSSNSVAEIISESKNNTLDDHLAEPEEIIPEAQNGHSDTILKEELSEIHLQNVVEFSNIAAEEIDKSEECFKIRPDQNDTVTNEQLSESKPEDVADSSDSIADIISESKDNILDDNLAEPEEIIPEAQNGHSDTILKEVLSKILFQDFADSSTTAAEEIDKSDQCRKTQPDQNDTVANEQLSEVKPEYVADSSDSVADINSESKNNTLDGHLAEPEEIIPEAQNGHSETILKEEFSKRQLQDVADSSNTSAEEIDKSDQCRKTQTEQNDIVANEQLFEVNPEGVADSSDSVAKIISESDHLAEPVEIIPETQNENSKIVLKEELSETQIQDNAAVSNIAGNELDKSDQCSKTQPDRNATVSNDQLSEVKPENVPDSSNSVAELNSESKSNTLDDHLPQPVEIIPEVQNGHSETILKEEVSEIHLQDVVDYSNIAAEEIDKSEECFKIKPDQNDTVANEQLSKVNPEDVADSSDSIADIIPESKNNILDDNLAEPEEIIPRAQNGHNETILKEELPEIQFQDVADSGNIAANEIDKSEECFKTQPDQNDTVANEQLSEAKPEDVADSSDSIADIIFESKNNILDDNLAEPEEIIPEAQNGHSETILKEELSEIQFQDVADSSNTAAEEIDKSDQCRKTQPDQNDIVANEQLSEAKPEDVAGSSNSIADIISESKNNILDDNLAEPEEIIPRAQNGHNETVLKEELPEIQFQDVADSGNIAANKIDKSEECFKTQPDQNDTVANEQLSEAKPEDVADSSDSVAEIISESTNNTLDDHLAEPEEIIPEAQNGHSDTILKEELSEIQLQDVADSGNIAANEIDKSEECFKTQPDQNDTVANEQLSEAKPEDVADSSDSVAEIISESTNNTLDDHLPEPVEIIPEAQNGGSGTIVKEELSEIQLQDVADCSNIAANEIDKSEEFFKTQPDQNETVANEQLSEAKPEDVADSSDSVAEIISESTNNTLDDHLAEPEEIIPEAQNGHSETILKEELSEIQFQDVADSSNTTAEEIDKSDQCRKTQPDQNDIVANEQLSEAKPEDVADSSNSIADIISESKNNILDDNLAEPEEIIPRAQNGHNETILKEELPEIQFQDVADSGNIAANEIDKSEECLKTQPDQNDTVANEQLSEAKPEDVADSSDSIADIISESKNNILDDNLAEPEEIIPEAQNGHSETILKEELSEIQFQDVADSSNTAAEEIDKSDQCRKTQPDQNDIVANEQLSEAKPEDVADSSNSIADIISESKNNILDDNLAEPEEIIPRAQNGHNETVLKEELPEIQFQDVADSGNIAANKIDKSEECFKTQPDQNDTVANEQLSEAKPEDVADSSDSIADIIFESKNNILDDNLAEPEEIIPEAQNGHSETILKEELSEIQFQDVADSSNTAAEEIDKSDQCRKTQPDQNNIVANEQLSVAKPEDVADSSNSIADIISESKNNILDDNLAEPEEIIPRAQNGHNETILKEELPEIQFQDLADSGNIAANEIDKSEECFKLQPDQNYTVANEQLSEAKPEDVADSSDSVAEIISESTNNTLNGHLAEPEEIIPEAQNGHNETILKEELPEIQFQDLADSGNIAANKIDKSEECFKTQPDQNDTVANEQLSEAKPEDVADSSDSIADIIFESKNNILDDNLAEPEEIIPEAQNGHSETILKEELFEIQFQDVADSSNTAAEEIDKSDQCRKTQPDQNNIVANEQLSEAKPEDVADSSNSIADIISESKNNILDDHLPEPVEIIPEAQNGGSGTIVKEELSEIQLQDVADCSNIAANEIDKSEEFFKTQPDQNETVANEQLSKVKPEDDADSSNSVAEVISEYKSNSLDDHLPEPVNIIPETQKENSETILKEVLSEIQLQDIADSSNIKTEEIVKSDQRPKTQTDQNDTVSTDQLSKSKPEDIPYSLDSAGNKNSLSENDKLYKHLADPDEIIFEVQNENSETILKEVLSEIHIQDVADSSNIAANEINKSEECFKTQPDQNDTVANEQLSKVKPEDVADSSDSVADIISESKNNTLNGHLAEPEEIIPEAKNGHNETILKEELSEIQFQDVADSSNIAAEEKDKSNQCRKTQPDQNDTAANEQLSEVKPEDIPESSDSLAELISEPKSSSLDDHLPEPVELIPETQKRNSETILKEVLSEIQLQDIAESSNIAFSELDKSDQCSKTQPDRNDTVSNEQLSEVKPENVPDSSNSVVELIFELKSSSLDDNLPEPVEIIPETQNENSKTILKEELSETPIQDVVASSSSIADNELDKSDRCSNKHPNLNETVSNGNRETILKEGLSEIQLQDVADSRNVDYNELDKSDQCSKTQPDRYDTVSNEQLSEVKPEDVPGSLNNIADFISEYKSNTLDDNLAEPDEIISAVQNGNSETILEEVISKMQLQYVADNDNELDKSDKYSKTQADQKDTVANKQLSEVKPEPVPDSSKNFAELIPESKSNTLDDHLADPVEMIPETQNGNSKTILKEEFSEIQLHDVAATSNVTAIEIDESEKCSEEQPDQNDTVSNEELSKLKPENVPDSSGSFAEIISESENNTLDNNLAQPVKIIPESQNANCETVFREELSEIQLQDVAGSNNIAAIEIAKSDQYSKTQPDQNDIVSNKHLSEVKPDDVPESSNSVADTISESKTNTCGDCLAEPGEIISETQDGNNETIIIKDLPEIQLLDVADLSNISANELDENKQFPKTQPNQNVAASNDQLSEVEHKVVSGYLNYDANKNSESKNYMLNDQSKTIDEISHVAQIVKSEAIFNEHSSEIKCQDNVEAKNISANELDNSEHISKKQTNQTDTVSNEQLFKIKPQEVLGSSNSVANKCSESESNISVDQSAELDEVISKTQNSKNEIILNEQSLEINLQDVAESKSRVDNVLDKSEKFSNAQPDENDTISNESEILPVDQKNSFSNKHTSEINPQDLPDSSNVIDYQKSKPEENQLEKLSQISEEIILNEMSVEEQNNQSEMFSNKQCEVDIYNVADHANNENGEQFKSEKSSNTQSNQTIEPSKGLNKIICKEQPSEIPSDEKSESQHSSSYDLTRNYNIYSDGESASCHKKLINSQIQEVTSEALSENKTDHRPSDNRIEIFSKGQYSEIEQNISNNNSKTNKESSPTLEVKYVKSGLKCENNNEIDMPKVSNEISETKFDQASDFEKSILAVDEHDNLKEKTTLYILEDQVSLDDSPTVTRQSTVLKIDDTTNNAKDNYNKTTDSLVPDSNPPTDQLSNDSNSFVNTRTNTFEEFLENGIEEKDILAINLNNNSITNTTLTTTNPVASTEIYSKINTNATKSNSNKQPVTNMSGYTATTKSNQRPLPNDLLTSAVQKRDTSVESVRRFRKQYLNSDQVKVESYTDGNYSNDVNINIDVGVGVVGDIDDGVNKDEDDDDVAIFRHFVPGSIAEREYKKWNNAVEMPNNPYAPEALKRRISGSQERFIDLPNISPTKDLNPLDLLNEQKLDANENIKRESDYKRYSRDYYINSSLTTPQLSPARDVSTLENKDNREPTKNTLSSTEKETEVDLYKAIPAQVVETTSSVTKIFSPLSKEHETNTTSTSDDSDTIKMYDTEKQRETNAVIEDKAVTQKEQPIPEKVDTKEEPSCLAFYRSESSGNVVTPARGSTPMAFKFLQPKRKLLEPSQVLSVDEEDPPTVSSPSEKPVIEAEIAKALPSVKALARAFLMTTNTTQPQKLWLRKARTLSQNAKKRPPSPKRSLDPGMLSERTKPEDDVTITSDLSSLETDSSSIGIEISNTSDLTTPAVSSANDSAVAGNTSPVPVREGVLKNNIAFFENLKNK